MNDPPAVTPLSLNSDQPLAPFAPSAIQFEDLQPLPLALLRRAVSDPVAILNRYQ